MQNISTFVVLIKMMFYDQIRKEVNLKINAMSTLLILYSHQSGGITYKHWLTDVLFNTGLEKKVKMV